MTKFVLFFLKICNIISTIGRESDFLNFQKIFIAFSGGAKRMEIAKNLLAVIELQPEKIPNWMVIVMGIGTVFVGLICIIILCKIMGAFFAGTSKAKEKPAAPVAVAPAAQNTVIENRQEIIAAVTAVAAEEMGKDISAIRVISFKKL